jgi:hypothetical protein
MNNWIFFTGVPGSRWSGIAHYLSQHSSVDNSDCNKNRMYKKWPWPRLSRQWYLPWPRVLHSGSYFGPGMEFGKLFENMDKLHPTELLNELKAPYTDTNYNQTRILKSHQFAYHLDFIKETFPKSKIMLVYLDNDFSLKRWLMLGGFDITYPNYEWYVDKKIMLEKIKIENQCILDFSKKQNITLELFTSEWVKTKLGWNISSNLSNYVSNNMIGTKVGIL